MTADHPEERGRVPVSDLRELVGEWVNLSETWVDADPEASATYRGCAKDLEELVAEYE